MWRTKIQPRNIRFKKIIRIMLNTKKNITSMYIYIYIYIYILLDYDFKVRSNCRVPINQMNFLYS